VPKLWWQTVTTTVFNLRCGALWRMYTLSWPPVVALTLPFLWVLLLVIAVRGRNKADYVGMGMMDVAAQVLVEVAAG
jgi:hypothetical protein